MDLQVSRVEEEADVGLPRPDERAREGADLDVGDHRPAAHGHPVRLRGQDLHPLFDGRLREDPRHEEDPLAADAAHDDLLFHDFSPSARMAPAGQTCTQTPQPMQRF